MCKKDRVMAQEKVRSVIRNARRDPQEGRDCPIHRPYAAIAPGLTPRAQQATLATPRYQLQLSISESPFAFDGAIAEMMADSVGTRHSSSLPVSFFNIAIQIERSYLSLVAKQEEFCCGPRQGN